MSHGQQAPTEHSARLRVRLLGAVHVEGDDGLQPLQGARKLALVALLSLRAPQVLSSSEIIHALWGGRPPESAHNTLQVHVSGVRKLLGRHVIQTSGAGYRLGAGVEVDVHDFEALAARGRTMLTRGDAGAASSALREALSFWAGPALHGLGSAAFADAESDRLETARLLALQHRIEADLQLGRDRDVLPELQGLVATHPLLEDLRALLMDALYQCGRQAEALRVFDAGRRLLREELGVDPSPRLKRAQHRVLAQPEAEGAVQREAGTRPRLWRPTPAPMPPNRTIGRDEDVAAVAHLLEGPRARLVSLVGPGGVGKTRLALEVAQVVQHRFRDGVAFIPAAQAERSQDVATVACQALGVSAGEDARSSLATALAGRDVLLVWDNFEHVLDAADLLSQLLAETLGARFLVTSRQALHLQAETRFPVLPLPTEVASGRAGAVELFIERARATDPRLRLTAEEISSVSVICARCDGLPLAVELAAAHAGSMTAAELADELALSDGLLSGAGRDYPDRQRSLRANIAWSVDLLPAAEVDFLARMTVFRGGFTLARAASVTGMDTATALAHIEKLNVCSLVQQQRSPGAPPRFLLLESVREYAARLLDAATTDEVSMRHALALRAFLDPPQHPARLPRLMHDYPHWLLERSNVRRAVRWARSAGEASLHADLVVGAFGLWFSNGPRGEVEEWLEHVLTTPGVPDGRRCDAYYDMARLRSRRSGTASAQEMLRAGLEIAEATRDRRRLMSCLCFSAVLRGWQKHHSQACVDLERARTIAHELGDVDCLVELYEAEGAVLYLAGDLDRAAVAYGAAVELASPLGLARQASFLNQYSESVMHTSPLRALEAAEEGYALALAVGERDDLASLLSSRGFARLLLGEHSLAVADLSASVGDDLAQGGLMDGLDTLPRLAAALVPGDPVRATAMLGAYEVAVEGATEGESAALVRREWLGGLADRLGERYEPSLESGRRLVHRLGPVEALRELCTPPGPAGDGP
ncbi:BTAD domain-containing putative transcriptional regulator [Pseudokineococcus sp. 5B2Z-1]|uniref:BTAD domain-containing putative transcriptional regulator n=1 Tax=Pseudokineococcus sp. 5B2Z-1 TaxID=3132744 RepID=UPI0030B6A9E2